MAHGASITRKIENCNYIVLGTKPGDTKLKEIESKEIPTVTEAEFVVRVVAPSFGSIVLY
jgi:BRCT domain type II-containing protein